MKREFSGNKKEKQKNVERGEVGVDVVNVWTVAG
jgi:hypothetical protein